VIIAQPTATNAYTHHITGRNSARSASGRKPASSDGNGLRSRETPARPIDWPTTMNNAAMPKYFATWKKRYGSGAPMQVRQKSGVAMTQRMPVTRPMPRLSNQRSRSATPAASMRVGITTAMSSESSSAMAAVFSQARAGMKKMLPRPRPHFQCQSGTSPGSIPIAPMSTVCPVTTAPASFFM